MFTIELSSWQIFWIGFAACFVAESIILVVYAIWSNLKEKEE